MALCYVEYVLWPLLSSLWDIFLKGVPSPSRSLASPALTSTPGPSLITPWDLGVPSDPYHAILRS